MSKFWTAERLAISEKLALVGIGAGWGSSWVAIAVRSDGSITVERFTQLNWIAAGVLICSVIVWRLARRQIEKAAHG
jgi:hypothetical protein